MTMYIPSAFLSLLKRVSSIPYVFVLVLVFGLAGCSGGGSDPAADSNGTVDPVVPADDPNPENTDPVTPDPVTPDPVTPDPVTPDPVTPDPVTPDPVTPDPVTPDPVTPDPVTPDPVTPDPVTPDPVTPDPVTPDPVTPDPVTPDPVTPDPVTPDPVTPDPVTPDPVTPDPVTPDPVTPDPVTPDPVTPDPVTPDPVTPDPVTPDPVITPDPVTPNPGMIFGLQDALPVFLSEGTLRSEVQFAVNDAGNGAVVMIENDLEFKAPKLKTSLDYTLAGGFGVPIEFAPPEQNDATDRVLVQVDSVGNVLADAGNYTGIRSTDGKWGQVASIEYGNGDDDKYSFGGVKILYGHLGHNPPKLPEFGEGYTYAQDTLAASSDRFQPHVWDNNNSTMVSVTRFTDMDSPVPGADAQPTYYRVLRVYDYVDGASEWVLSVELTETIRAFGKPNNQINPHTVKVSGSGNGNYILTWPQVILSDGNEKIVQMVARRIAGRWFVQEVKVAPYTHADIDNFGNAFLVTADSGLSRQIDMQYASSDGEFKLIRGIIGGCNNVSGINKARFKLTDNGQALLSRIINCNRTEESGDLEIKLWDPTVEEWLPTVMQVRTDKNTSIHDYWAYPTSTGQAVVLFVNGEERNLYGFTY